MLTDEDLGGKDGDLFTFANLLQIVDRLQADDYDLFGELEQVSIQLLLSVECLCV